MISLGEFWLLLSIVAIIEQTARRYVYQHVRMLSPRIGGEIIHQTTFNLRVLCRNVPSCSTTMALDLVIPC